MTQITKEYKFCAAHKYWNNKWDKKKNYEVFGDDIYNHGHNYILRITIKGKIDPESGFIVNLMWLNNLINEKIINSLDHKQIDSDIDWFKDKSPSTENLVKFIWNILNPFFTDLNSSLHKIYLRETPTIFTEYYGPNKNEEI